jgi:hypothetical protein
VDKANASAQERIAAVRRDEPGADKGKTARPAAGPADEQAPTGI